MKKILFIFLVAFMSLGGRAAAQDTISFNDLFIYSTDEGCYQMVETEDILSNLKSKGFELTATTQVMDYVYDETQDDWVEALVPKNTYSKNGINISFIDDIFMEIVFSNQAELKNFLSEMEANGWEGEDNSYDWHDFNYGQPIMATVDGLKISFDMGE